MDSALCLGLISGTSADGIDAVLVRLGPGDADLELIASRTTPYPDALRTALLACARSDAQLALAELGRLDRRVGMAFADAAQAVCRDAGIAPTDVTVVGSHGQTLFHGPGDHPPHTLQIGDPNTIAAALGIPVVADFRRADMAAGGEGAPLAPALHAALWSGGKSDQAVINLGGIANITLLPADANQPVIAFDSGPANCLMDVWAQQHRDTGLDAGGQWAAQGQIQPKLLAKLLDEPYLQRPAPKSTGRELFNAEWLTARLAGDVAPVDVQRTLLELTVISVRDALRPLSDSLDRVLICGGGAHNTALMSRFTEVLAPATVTTTASAGLAPDWVEAVAFAWLAWRRLSGLPGNLPTVTGARQPAVLGGLYAPPPAVER